MSSNTPKVSFVVPCYKLAHLLPECVNSILSQTYTDLEVIIMDDNSPDNTAEISASFKDPRVRYIRNDQNLGHLRNYNKGIELSCGKYIWIISADDRLRVNYVLEHYVSLMEDNPNVGYACCPAVILEKGKETTIKRRIVKEDTIFKGRNFLSRLLKGNCVVATSGMARRVCYENYGGFPLDLPYTGDWFLWCLFACHYDVAYFAEPMVNYRAHEITMTNYLLDNCSTLTFKEGFIVLRRIKEHAKQIGDNKIVEECKLRLARLYGLHLVGGKFEGRKFHLTEEEFEHALSQESMNQIDKNRTRTIAWTAAGDFSCMMQKFNDAREFYSRASRCNPLMIGIRARQLLIVNDIILSIGIKLFKLKRSIFGDSDR